MDTCWAETSFFPGSTAIVAPDLMASMNNKSATFLSDMRARLLELREQLESVAAASEDSSQIVELDQVRVGRLSRMDALQAQAMSQASGRRREMMVRKISAALERIDTGNYGRCQSCEEMISCGRLASDPTAVLCIECAKKAEQK